MLAIKQILTNKELTAAEKVVAVLAIVEPNMKPGCIASETGMSRNTVWNARKTLNQKKGVI